jgi:hypothetical protein
MSELLDRTLDERTLEQREGARGTGPPTPMPEIERRLTPRWPRRAKVATAVLGTLALAGAFGIALLLGDEADTDAQIAEVTEQRDALADENDALVADLEQVEADNAELTADLEQVEADNAELTADLARAQSAGVGLGARLATATAQVDDLTEQVDAQQLAIEAVTAERDALVAMFPMVVDTSLVGVDVVGTYRAAWLPAYNSGLTGVTLPGAEQVTISETPEGWLQVVIPGVVTADLTRTDGALFTMVDTTTVVPPVDGVARIARVAITIYAGETITTQDGVTTVTDLGMSVAISTPAVGAAPAGVVLYGAELTPQR